MRQEKDSKIFRIVMALVFLGIGVKDMIDGDYVLGAVALILGIGFGIAVFVKNGKQKETI